MPRREKREKKQSNKTFRKLLIVAIFLIAVLYTLKYAYNYVRNDVTDKTNLIINNSNVTTSLKKELFIQDGVVYLAKEDIYNFFDPYIYYEEKYNQIITGSNSRIAAIVIGEKKMTNNGSTVSIPATVIEKDNTYYVPFSALDDIYNVKTTYIEETDTVVVDSLDRKMVVADSSKDNNVKQERTTISRTVAKLKKGENITVVNDTSKNGWIKIRTDSGKLGYVKEDSITNYTTIRGDMTSQTPQIEGNISMVWEYFSEYGSAPYRTEKIEGVNVASPTFFTLKRLGKGEIHSNVGNSGEAYIKWAHENGCKVWPSISNNSYIDTTSEIMNDYKLRQNLINDIVSLVVRYDLDGINIDFENMYAKDKKLFNRFIIELAPRLKEIGAVLSVDVTAPDGSENWSMCYDRHTIGKVADYIVFMGYDQNGNGKVGTSAGCDWVEVNLKKFVGTQEEVDSKKIILGIPFYTRMCYTTSNGKNEALRVGMNKLDSMIPSNAKKTWDDNLKQNVAEYTSNGINYKAWIEDEKSIEAKLDLAQKYNLAGAAYWKKDFELDSIWNLISSKLKIK